MAAQAQAPSPICAPLVIEELAMATTSKDTQQRLAAAAVKEERALDKVAAMQEYEAEVLALRANTERLRALRLAREAENLPDSSTQQPAKKQAAQETRTQQQDTRTQQPAKKKAVKRVSAPKRAGGKPPVV
jgi:hypothetical protein